jgi:hypothetical protein
MAMALHTLADHLAFENVEGCEQGGGAMSLVVVREGCGAALLHRQAGLSSVERLDLALLVNRQNDGVVRRIDIKADDVAQLGDELRVIGELEPTHSVRLQAVGPPERCTVLTLIPTASAMLRPSNGWRFGTVPPRCQGHHALGNLGSQWRDARGPRLVPPQGGDVFGVNGSCQRQMTVLAFPVRRMISAVPWPSAVSKTILARQTCF